MLPVTKSVEYTIKTIAVFSIFLFLISVAVYFELALNFVILAVLIITNLILLIYSMSLFFHATEKTAYILFKITSPYLAIVFLIVIIHALI
jgi:protoheme IX farnesyltransferase